MSETGAFISVFSGSMVEAELLKSLLRDAGIGARLDNQYMGTLAPWVESQGGAGAVHVIVPSADADRASGIISDMKGDETASEEGWEFSAS